MLHKTVIVIWSKEDTSNMELVDIAREATCGSFYCAHQSCVPVPDHVADDDWDGTEFFDPNI
jgi:hypothetical protein